MSMFDIPAPQTRWPFEIISVWLDGSYRDGTRAFAIANYTVGPFSFQSYVTQRGSVALPHELRDPELRHEITTAILRRVWVEFTEHLKQCVARDKENLPRLKEQYERAVAEHRAMGGEAVR
jgi:hypothetical protein